MISKNFDDLIKSALNENNICHGCGEIYRNCECEALERSDKEDYLNRQEWQYTT